jgi:glucokinase
MLLVGDNGATKTSLAIFASRDNLRAPLLAAELPCARYESLAALIKDFLADVTYPITQAVFGVAGPVVDGSVKITSLPWHISERQLAEELQIPTVKLLNDLEAIAYAVPLLTDSELSTLNQGTPVAHAPIAVVASGTGFGAAFLLWNGTRYQAYPSEGGLANFAPSTLLEADLLADLLKKQTHVCYDLLGGGAGFLPIYDYLKNNGGFAEPEEFARQLAASTDPNPLIVAGALHPRKPIALCEATLKVYASILGGVVGNTALQMLSTGGVYIGGGIPPRILSFLHGEDFRRSFQNKGALSDFVTSVPVHVILTPTAGLLGAATYGFGIQ